MESTSDLLVSLFFGVGSAANSRTPGDTQLLPTLAGDCRDGALEGAWVGEIVGANEFSGFRFPACFKAESQYFSVVWNLFVSLVGGEVFLRGHIPQKVSETKHDLSTPRPGRLKTLCVAIHANWLCHRGRSSIWRPFGVSNSRIRLLICNPERCNDCPRNKFSR